LVSSKRLLIVLLLAILSIPTTFFASAAYFQAMVEEEFRSGARLTTDGDSPMIPAVSVTVAWTCLLLLAAAVAALGLWVKAWRRRNAA
jgi:hypothetical protein